MMSDLLNQIKRVAKDACDEIAALVELMRPIAAERDELKAELTKLQAERDHFRALSDAQAGETRDNGDGTETRLLPVTYPKGLDVECVRSPKRGGMFVSGFGARLTCNIECIAGARLILRPAPKPPEPVTWEAPALADGEWIAWQDYAEFIGNRRQWFVWWGTIRGLNKPAKLGRYEFKDGVGTMVEEYGNV